MEGNKILIKRLSNSDSYNELTIEKSNVFLDNLQRFLININLITEKECTYEIDGQKYDLSTYHVLFYDPIDEEKPRKKWDVDDFTDGYIVRYHNKDIELLILFLQETIKLVFYCNQEHRQILMNALMKFCVLKRS